MVEDVLSDLNILTIHLNGIFMLQFGGGFGINTEL